MKHAYIGIGAQKFEEARYYGIPLIVCPDAQPPETGSLDKGPSVILWLTRAELDTLMSLIQSQKTMEDV